VALLLGIAASAAVADVKEIAPSKDNTMYEYFEGYWSNGKGSRVLFGYPIYGWPRRGLLAFDVAGNIPAGSTITAVDLKVYNDYGGTDFNPIELIKVLADWGEGTSNADGVDDFGVEATIGDVTWEHTFFDTSFWTYPGGDFENFASAQLDMYGAGEYHFVSEQMLLDVKEWYSNPAKSFGWVIMNESYGAATLKGIGSREHADPAKRPSLKITYTPPANEKYYPTAATTLKGTYNSGNLSSFTADDDNYWVQGAQYDPTDPLAVINSTLQADTNVSKTAYSSGKIKVVEKTNTTQAKYRIRAAKAAGGFAVLVDNQPTGFTESTFAPNLPSPISDLIDNTNNKRMRLEIRAASNNKLAGFFRHSIDMTEWELIP
jgi:hypothetical protein